MLQPKRTIVEQEHFYFTTDRLVRWLDKHKGLQMVDSAESRERMLRPADWLAVWLADCQQLSVSVGQ